jgi:ABC-type spermidine/putrescine transport system permease subunit II
MAEKNTGELDLKKGTDSDGRTTPWPPWTAGLILTLMVGIILCSWIPLVSEVFLYQKKFHGAGSSLMDDVLDEGPFLSGFFFTLKIALGSAFISGLGGTLLALLIGISCQRLGGLGLLLGAPLFIPHVVAAQMLVLFLGQSGLLNRLFYQVFLMLWGEELLLEKMPQYLFDSWGVAVILGLSFKEIPFVATLVLPVALGIFQGFGPMARNLGISWMQFFIKVLLPTIGPAAAVASFMCLAYGLVSFEIPVMLGRTLPKVASAQALEWYQTPIEKGRPLAFCLGGIVTVVGCFFCFWFFRAYERYRYILSAYRQSLGVSEFLFDRAGANWHVFRWSLGILLLFFLLPLWPLLTWSFAVSWPWPHLVPHDFSLASWKTAVETEPSFFDAALGSLIIATGTMMGSLFLGIPLAHRMAEQKTHLVGRVAEMIPLTPLFIPGFMIAMGLSSLFMSWQNTPFMIVSTIVCHVIAFSPYFTFSLSSWILTQGNLEEQAAATLGVGPWRVYCKVTIPKLLPAIKRGGLFVFIASFGDVILTMTTQGYVLPTLPMTLMPLLAGGERSLGAVAGFLTIAVPGTIVFLNLFLIYQEKTKI